MAINLTHITDYLDLNSTRFAHKPALVCDDKTLSWLELKQQVDAMESYLYKKIGEQDSQKIIAILLANSWQFVIAYLAGIKLGHIVLPIDATFKELEVSAILDQISSEIIISDAHYRPLVADRAEPIEVFEDIDLSAAEGTQPKELRLDATQQIASLFFTSGTTGLPKAAPNTHRNHIWNIEQCSKVWEWDSDDTWLISVQLSHMLGLVMGLSGVIYHGNTMYLQAWFDEVKTLQTLASGKVTMFTHISSIFSKLVETPGDYDISGVRLCISGGSALPPAIWREFKDRFGAEILECYGTTETGRIASNLLNERIPGSPGRPLEGVDFKLSSDKEVLIRSEGVFPGYYKNPNATKSSTTEDGYWKTGDIAKVENGRIILKGRIQERIRRFGYTLSPRDIEWALYNNPKIKDVYVLGTQSPDQPNDSIVYFIKSDLSNEEIINYCKANLPFAWRADRIIKLDSIPRTKNGKPKIDKLKQLAESPAHA